MKFEERIANEYFKFKKYDKIIFEPLGNTPPDFLINNSIAVEVRRLNKFHLGKPLEEIEYNVIPKIEKFISLFDNNETYGNTTIVFLIYSRPIKFTEFIKQKIEENAYLLTLKIPSALVRYVIKEGSIALNGISLTVANIKGNLITVSIIPHTWDNTNLHELTIGGKINIETDLLSKYAEKIINTKLTN